MIRFFFSFFPSVIINPISSLKSHERTRGELEGGGGAFKNNINWRAKNLHTDDSLFPRVGGGEGEAS